MTRTKRLSPVLKLTEKKERDAAISLAIAQQKLIKIETKLEQLKTFREEYAGKLQARKGETLAMTELQEYQAFLNRLDEGITALTDQIEIQKQHRDKNKANWNHAHLYNDAMDKLIQKFKEIEGQFSRTREANEIDELSQRMKCNQDN